MRRAYPDDNVARDETNTTLAALEDTLADRIIYYSELCHKIVYRIVIIRLYNVGSGRTSYTDLNDVS